MDLSNLSSHLPPSTAVSQEQLDDLDRKSALEFKNAANSVATLYRLSKEKQAMIRHKGYLDCIDDLLNLIKLHKYSQSESELEEEPQEAQNGGRAEEEFDIENWCLTKKAELMGGANINTGLLEERIEEDTREGASGGLPKNYDFTINYPSGQRFRPSKSLMSVERKSTKPTRKMPEQEEPMASGENGEMKRKMGSSLGRNKKFKRMDQR